MMGRTSAMQAKAMTSKDLNAAGNGSQANSTQNLVFGLSLDEHRSLMSVGPGVHYVCQAHGDFAALFIAPSIKAQFGYDPEDFTSKPGFWADHIHSEDRPRVFDDLELLFVRDFHRHEYRFLHKDGGYRWVFDELRLLRDASGEPSKIVGQWIDITDQKREQAAAAKSERRFQDFADNAVEGILVHRNFRPVFANQALADIFGYAVDEIMAMESILALIAPHDRETAAGYGEARVSGENPPSDYELQGVHKDGSLIWLRNMARQIVWDNQTAVQSIMIDMTKQKSVEIELRDSEARRRENEARLRTILDNAPIAIYLKDTEGRFVFSNRRNAEWYGVDSVEAIGRTTADYFPADYAKIAVARDQKVIETRETLAQETDIQMPDGRRQHCLIFRVPTIDADGKILGVLGMNLDITERNRAEIALREAETRVRDFAEATSDWFWETDIEDRVTHLSSSAADWQDMSFDDRVGNTRFDFAEFDGEPQKWRQHREDLDARRPFRDFRYKRPALGGGILHLSISGRPFFDLDGTFLGYRGTGMDVTAEVDARSQLVDAIDSMADGVVIFDAEDRLVTSNARYRETYKALGTLLKPGARIEDLARAAVEQGLFTEAIGREEDWLRERLENFHQGKNLAEQRMADGTWLQITERKTPNGYTIGIRTDITELKEREAQLRQAQKMEAIGQLTGGVAHDFNNMLAAIIGNLELIQDGEMAPELDKEGITIALKAAYRGAEVTHRLLAFSRQQELDAKVTEINQILPEFGRLAQRTIGADIAIEMKLAANLWPTMVDAGELENALLNLTINARDAMPNGGLLVIETANQVLEEGGTATPEDLAPGPYVMIAVSDSGTGMPAEVRERVFEPFFTTKEVGEGTGLGLSMVFGFAKQSGGHVSVYSEAGVGTTVRIYLPREEETADTESPTEPSQNNRPTGDETIMVVEDDEAVRDYLVTVLRQLGYNVEEAEDGPAALEVMAASGSFDLLLTDVILPRGMSGRDIAVAFRERYPAAGVMYSSGYTREILNRRGQLEEGVVLMNKPYQAPALAQRVREVLDSRA
jgi:PAS domain S-box-containing protein